MVLLYGSAALATPAPGPFPGPSTTGYAPGTVFDNAHTVGTGTGQQSSGPGWVIQGTGSSAFVKVTGQASGALTSLQGLYIPMNIAVRANHVLIQNCLIIAPPNKNGIDVINISGSVTNQPVTPSTDVTIDHNTVTSSNPVSAQPMAFTCTSANPCVFSVPTLNPGFTPTVGQQIILSSGSTLSQTLPQGFGDLTTYSFTATTASVFTAKGTNYLPGQPITISAVSGTTFPTGITAGTYYVINPGISGAGTFQLSNSPTGTAISITAAGGGQVNPPWYVIASVTGANSFTLAYNVFPSAALASGSTGSGNCQQMNTATTGSCGIKDDNGATLGLVITANDVSNCTSGIQCEQGLVQGNYLHDLNYAFPPGPGASHLNGFSSGGNTSSWENPMDQVLTVRGNTSLNPWTQSDAIALFQDAAQQAHRVVDGNLVAGAGFAMTCGHGGALKVQPTPTDIVIKNNRFSTMYYPQSGIFGPADGWTTQMSADNSNNWSNNAYYESGTQIPVPSS